MNRNARYSSPYLVNKAFRQRIAHHVRHHTGNACSVVMRIVYRS